jgi:1-deoxy-D-xylulose-5-phosphate reductoisomerase
MQARLAILGATGSIGRQAVEVAAAHRERLHITALACRSQVDECDTLARPLGARVVVVERDGDAALAEVAGADDVDLVVVGIPGIAALGPTLAALRAGKAVAIAAKEVLVVAGHLIRGLVPEGAGPRLRPIDSEHCALWQCLRGEDVTSVAAVTLTASGGPFRDVPLAQLAQVTVERALQHPTWRMGPKVTIDAATLVNKGYEVIEAHWLFDLPYASITAVIHPESVVHALVEFRDGSVKAQLAVPDMRLPIQYALLYPDRLPSAAPRLEWLRRPAALRAGQVPQDGRTPTADGATYAFRPIDPERYPCFGVVLEAGRRGGAATIAVNAADEVGVERFLRGEARLSDIAALLERALAIADGSGIGREPDLDTILAFDAEVRRALSVPAVV